MIAPGDMHTFTTLFLGFLALTLATQLWLGRRHIRHVLQRREHVPNAFQAEVPLEAHRKAADYTVARARLGRWETIYSTLLLLAWTLGGGLDALDRLGRSVFTS